jgi:spheroidene monooxygenase
MKEKKQIVTISFFRYEGFSNKRWGMGQMYRVREPMRRMAGVQFFKPLGTGSGLGYSIIPNLSLFGLLVVWESREAADRFMEGPLFGSFKSHSAEQYTIFLKPLSSRGSWSGFSDWSFHEHPGDTPLIAALTRATIKTRFLYGFWRMVARTSREHSQSKGLIFSQGIGEIPFFEQATFTVWEDFESMRQFAFESFHGEAIAKTRKNNGFREEMFTRLLPYDTRGTWLGQDKLRTCLSKQKAQE